MDCMLLGEILRNIFIHSFVTQSCGETGLVRTGRLRLSDSPFGSKPNRRSSLSESLRPRLASSLYFMVL